MIERMTIPQTDLHVARIGLGTGDWGAGRSVADTDRVLQAYLEAGGNLLDTAHCYAFWLPGGEGKSERTVGELVRRHGVRDAMVIATKGGHCDAGPAYARPRQSLRSDLVRRDVQESVDRLGLGAIDLFYLHRDDGITPVAEVMETLNACVRQGHLRHIAASNWSVRRMQEANEYARSHGLQAFCASQMHWSLGQVEAVPAEDPVGRCVRAEERAWHAANGMPLVAYSPTVAGFFSKPLKESDTPALQARHARVEALARELGCTPGQLALAWLLNQPIPVIALTGTTSVAHLKENIGALAISLTPQQLRWLEEGRAEVS